MLYTQTGGVATIMVIFERSLFSILGGFTMCEN